MYRLQWMFHKRVQEPTTPNTPFPPSHFYSPIKALRDPGAAYYGGGSLWIEKLA